MKIISQKIGQSLTLNQLAVVENQHAETLVQKGKHIVIAVDVSYSMYHDLPKIKRQLKNRIPDVVGVNDTVSIIVFSGRTQAYIIKEGATVNNVASLQALNDAIDRYLSPIGATAFLPPLELLEEVIDRLKHIDKDFSFIFLSDGYNNDSSWSGVIEQLTKLESKLAAATFIEYGYYADSAALTEMAETVGGEKIFAKDFESYEHDFTKIITKKTAEKRKFDIAEIKSKLSYQWFFTLNPVDGTINVYSSKSKDHILLPEDVTEVYCLTQYKPTGADEVKFTDTMHLTVAFLLADRLKYKHVEDVLVQLGDIDLLDQFAGAFGKQKLNSLKDSLKEFSLHPNTLYANGKQEGYKINPKQYCVMDLVNDLAEGDNSFFPYHPDFNYNRIGAKRTQKVELTDEAQAALVKAKTLKEVEAITSNIEAAEFVYPENAATIGSPFNTLVWNEKRANLSIQTKLFGTVKLPSNDFGLTEVSSFIYRNYTLIKDGILNVTQIPVKLDGETVALLADKKANITLTLLDGVNDIWLMDISKLPIINRSMTVNQSAKKLANLEFDLIQAQLGQKYLKTLKDTYDPKKNDVSASKYSVEAADWLKSIGVNDFNGFSPKTETNKTGDIYIAPVLDTKIQNTSTAPKVADVLSKVEALDKKDPKAKELNVMESIMKSQIDNVHQDIFGGKEVDVVKINELTKQFDKLRRNLLFEIAKIKFGVILSRTWFTEFETLEQNTLEGYKFKGLLTPLKVVFDFGDKEIKI
jgi:hypothetical protein